MLKRIRVVAALAAVALAVLSVACGGDDDDDKGAASSGSSTDSAAVLSQVPAPNGAAPAGSKVFVGHDKDNKASVGLIVFSDNKAAGYACDGDKTWTWYTGSASGNELTLTGTDGAKLTAKIDGSKVTGSTSGAQAVSFTLDAATPTNHAGLFRDAITKGSDSHAFGWVIENDGSVRGGATIVKAGTTTRLGAVLTTANVIDVQALPEFPEIKRAIPGFPVIPQDLTVFTLRDGLCTRLALGIIDSGPTVNGGSPNTAANRARLGMLGRLGCKQEALFALA